MLGPDFVVVGAPKCGTTSLYQALSKDPKVFVAPKEPHYFGSDLRFAGRRMSRSDYECLFSSTDAQIRGDVSVWYLFSRLAAEEIQEFNPGAKIIIMLRNPVDQMYSMHSQALFNRDETEPSFERALALEEARRSGSNLPAFPYAHHAVFYREIATFSKQIKRYRDSFPPEQIHYIVLDDLHLNPTAAWGELQDFLGVPSGLMPEMDAANPNKIKRSTIVANVATFLPRVAAHRLGLSRLPRPMKDRLINLHGSVRDWNRIYAPRAPMRPALRSQLVDEFADEVSELETILDRDFSQWRS